MRSVLLSFIIGAFVFTGCSKEERLCGCVPPPAPESKKWKITKIFGGIGGVNKPLTEDQRNNTLIIYATGAFACHNTVTGITVEGTLTISNFNSIYGPVPRYVFSPALPMLAEDPLLLVDSANNKMVFGENITDSYLITFGQVP